MIIKNKYLLFLLLLFILACSKEDNGVDPPIDNDDDELVVNNTRLDPATTLYGLITDKQNNPLHDVVVTDGFTTSKTDQNGVYQLVRNRRAKFVYYSTPADCKIAVDVDNHPKFYEKLISKDKLIRQDFKLEKQPLENEFTLFCVSDPQCRNERELNRYKFETIPDINQEAAKFDRVYAITLGDIIFDSPALWNAMKATMAGQSVPFFQTIGNHDHLETADNEEKAVEGFQENFGPTDYSFNRGNVHIISMDNVIYTGKQQYSGGFTESQWKWLQEDLSHVSSDKMVILNCHIPFRTGGTSDHRTYHAEVLELLSTFAEAHIMIGHTHYQINYLHKVKGKTIYEHVHGAACGAWWNSDWCADGTPNGYGVYEIEGNTMKNWYYKATKEPADFQIRAYDASKEFGPANKYTYVFGAPANLNLTGDGWVVANIWNADEDWDVKLYQDGMEIGPMTRRSSKDYWVLYHHLEQLGKAVGSTFDRSSNHFFVGRLNGKTSEANFRIEAKDPFGNIYTTTELE
ncbi:MAG: calcineurin-like phosphoesterase family protein [bacterium]|nr:calcineurin-like phosphoesterase family protein [bacterium]MDD3623965.1 calcineurin-like phosphoesterase family protein [Proteiniphilum sp.]MDD3968541.1 calcineurin-like phosphoesterase family protein [Proteiniphilum sp.]MDD4459717.1 calcineurin-like phosphoesterase family protein [Proteiniphilum sp.]